MARDMAMCASCHQPLPDGARFCPACGHEASRGAPEERRVVTVMFADLVGYTALSEHLDPERVKRLIDAAFERLIVDINAYGGRIDKILGDGILALFGAPVAHEDDADRAIRAAIQMHETLRRFVDDEADLVAPLQLRIGVNTGEVLVGAISGTADYTAMGDVVNVASRLQALAKPGEVFIGESTADLSSDEILLELVDDLVVKGREQPARVWRVTGRQRRIPMASSREDLPFVGRAAQRELLSSITAMVAGGRSAVVAVSGEAGSGKTRLIAEALADFPAGPVAVFAGICAPYGETNVWSPIATALFRKLAIQPGMPAEPLRELLISKGIEAYGFARDDSMLQRFVSGAMHLLGYPSDLDLLTPAQSRETVFALIVESLRRRSGVGPIVLWLDDMQWADVLIVDLLRRIARSLADRPVLIITAQRDGAELDWPPSFEQPMTVRMPLEPLERDEASDLVAAVLGGRVAPATIDRLYERSGGNPLFLTELAELAKDQPSSRELPGSLRALIAARLDQLPPGQRSIIDNAAVLGVSGQVESLDKFAGEMRQRFDPADVDALADCGLLQIDGDQWRFRSDVVREVAYQTLTKLVRAQRHAGTAAVMSKSAMMPIETTAHHAASAAELVAEIGPVPGVSRDITEQAAYLLRDASQRSLDVGAFNHARRYATRALELDADDAVLQRELLLLRAQAQTERRVADEARLDADAALDAAVVAADRRHEGIARRLLGILHQREGNLPRARRELGESVEIFRELGDDIELATSLRERGFAEVFGGSLDDAEWLLGEAEALSDSLDDRRGRAWVRQHQAWAAFFSGNSVLAETRLMAAAQEFDLLGDRAGRGWALGLLAWVRFHQGRFEEAEKLASKVRTESVALGDRWAPAMMDSLVAAMRVWTTRFADAEVLSRKALTAFRELGDQFGVILALGPHLRAEIALGRSQDAERGMEEALAISERFGDLAIPALTVAGAAVHLGVGSRAVSVAETAVERGRRMGTDPSEAKVTLALALCQAARPDDALGVLETIGRTFSYREAVRALALAMTGQADDAIAAADSVAANGVPTYLDDLLGTIAAAAAAARLGDRSAMCARLDTARRCAADAGDQAAIDVVESVVAALGAGEGNERHALPIGWRTVVEGLGAAAEAVPQP